jgi:hypothetical protein
MHFSGAEAIEEGGGLRSRAGLTADRAGTMTTDYRILLATQSPAKAPKPLKRIPA